jgi:hypothetical protein
MVMDVLRSHYRGTVLALEGDETTTTGIRWYPARKDAKAFPHIHAFGSGIWEGPPTAPIYLGELGHGGEWRPKRYPAAPGDHFHGPAEWFAAGIPPDQLGQGDADRRCGVPAIEDLAGVQLGGAAVFYPVTTFTPLTTCADCTVNLDSGDITDLDPLDYELGTQVYIANTGTGAMGHWIVLQVAGSIGFIDLCTCSYSWWCVNGDCVPSAGPPDGATSGPYISQACCVAACVAVRCCNEPGGPNFPPEGEVVAMQHESGPCLCLTGVQGPGNALEGTDVVGSWTGACGAGMLDFQGHVYCDQPELGIRGWKMDWNCGDADNPACSGSGTVPVSVPPEKPFTCNPMEMWFKIPNFPGICCSGSDEPEQVWAHWTGPAVTPPSPAAGTPAATRSAPATARTLPCVYLGQPTGAEVLCGGCRNKTRLKVFGCDVYGQCTADLRPDKASIGLQACGNCPDYLSGASHDDSLPSGRDGR